MSDNINHPAHYTQWPVEVIYLTEREGFLYGNVLKYALRAGVKLNSSYEEDMAKATWYAARLAARIAKVTSPDDGLRALRKRGDSAFRYLADRPEDTTEMSSHLRNQLAIIYSRVERRMHPTWDAT
jgi:hypothetical protein